MKNYHITATNINTRKNPKKSEEKSKLKDMMNEVPNGYEVIDACGNQFKKIAPYVNKALTWGWIPLCVYFGLKQGTHKYYPSEDEHNSKESQVGLISFLLLVQLEVVKVGYSPLFNSSFYLPFLNLSTFFCFLNCFIDFCKTKQYIQLDICAQRSFLFFKIVICINIFGT
ncbi:hypothetical protein RFI_36861 [Reticulomyxa filosa]|uniref:Mitochondrial import receptor subunit TOM7 n=1 Tax=Reticulomyxa filosa TaxID=46433 RepID=X6LF04_RETFI|nr:hypothetical protein RFI_36861 [Reticulomyxa filosa]|eukprot:ETO00578.1 hypothetical protein RFI_36861 [Reticulomyxa filosa]